MRRFNVGIGFKMLGMLGAACAVVCVAQPSGQPSAGSPSPLPALIHALSGKWHLDVHIEAMGEGGKPIDGQGEESWSGGPGDIALIEKEHIPMPGGEAFLLGLIWWDAKQNRLNGMECNSQLPFTCDLKGALNDITISWDGSKFQVDELETHGDKHTVWHEAWTEITPHSFLQTGDVTMPDGTTKRFMTIRGTRVQKLETLGVD